MSKNSSVFDLIKSLSKSEKRHFKLQASRYKGGQSNYTKVFDELDKQKEYDEKAIKQKFKNKTFVKQFNTTKLYLYNLILETLELYHTDKSSGNTITNLLGKIEILYSKSLYEQAQKLISKAKKTAYTNGEYQLISAILSWEKKIASAYLFQKSGKTGINNIMIEEGRAMKILKSENKAWYIYARVLEYQNRLGSARDHITKYKASLKDITTYEAKDFISTQAKEYILTAKALYYSNIGENKKALINQRANYELLKSNPAYEKKYPNKYLACLSNLIILEHDMGDMRHIEPLLNSLKALKDHLSKSKDTNLKHRSIVLENVMTIEFLTKKGTLDAAWKKMEDFYTHYEKAILEIPGPYIKHLYYRHLCLAFYNEEYDRALNVSELILDKRHNNYLEELTIFTQIIVLLTHYEKGNTILLPSIIRSLYRSLIKKQRAYKFERLLIRILRRINNTFNKQELNKILASSLPQLKNLSKKPEERSAFRHFDFISWIEAKLENKPVQMIFTEKYKRLMDNN